jgi:hypothetical protein
VNIPSFADTVCNCNSRKQLETINVLFMVFSYFYCLSDVWIADCNNKMQCLIWVKEKS